MNGWLAQKRGSSSFSFSVNDDGDLLLYYEDNKAYPEIYVDDNGNIMCEYTTWYPNLSLDDDMNLLYTYDDNPVITMDEDFNIIYESSGALGFDKMFYIDDNGDLIYKYGGVPLDIHIDQYRNVIMNVE